MLKKLSIEQWIDKGITMEDKGSRMNIEIRKGTIKDLSEIQKLSQAHFIEAKEKFDSLYNDNYPYLEKGVEYFKNMIKEKANCSFVAIYNDRIVGFITGTSQIDFKYTEGVSTYPG